MNRDAANSSFENKKKIYAKSELKITQELVAIKSWNKDAVLARAEELGKAATTAWAGPAKVATKVKAKQAKKP